MGKRFKARRLKLVELLRTYPIYYLEEMLVDMGEMRVWASGAADRKLISLATLTADPYNGKPWNDNDIDDA